MTLADVRAAVGARLLAEPHHDGSELYLLERPADLGDEATVRLRVARDAAPERVVLRHERDGEPRNVEAVVDEEAADAVWWRATFPVWNPVTRYRWLLDGGDVGFAWLTGAGLVRHEVTDADDFVVTVGKPGPAWHLDSVVYEVFPDRFARGAADAPAPAWAVPREWDALPTGRGRDTPREWFGGDLAGVERHLDHIESLGANLIYLTPFFPAQSTHRYDATTFDYVDPLLGGDEALVSLVRAAHARGVRVVGDITLNHTGDGHEWFETARADAGAPERSFYYFDDAIPAGYESWMDIPSLPKLDWRSPELRARIGAVLRRFLEPPFDLDGWRVDVANMLARFRDVDLNAEVSRWASEVVGERLLVGEHGHDFRPDLARRGWHGVMNYAGFTRPLWAWLLRDEPAPEQTRLWWGMPVAVPRLDGAAAVATMRAFRAGVPWDAVLHSWVALDSHDTARFRTVAGSRDRHLVGVGMQMATPGVPMIFAGDEVGLEGEWGEDARRTMPWSRPERWDTDVLDGYRSLVGLRRSSEALARGGLRYAHVGTDAIAFLRETADERLLVLAARDDHEPVRLPLEALGCRGLTAVHGGDAFVDDETVTLPADGPAFHVWRLQ